MPFTIGTGGAPNIPDGTYKAQLLRVEDGIPTKFGNSRKWYWLIDVAGTGEELSQLTSENTAPGTVSYRQLVALTGREPAVGETIEDPTGKTVLMDIKRKQNGWPGVEAVRPFVAPTEVEAGVPR